MQDTNVSLFGPKKPYRVVWDFGLVEERALGHGSRNCWSGVWLHLVLGNYQSQTDKQYEMSLEYSVFRNVKGVNKD